MGVDVRYELDLSRYTVEIDNKVCEYPLRQNLCSWLRMIGIFRSADDVAEAVLLARRIREHGGNKLRLDETEARILRTAIDRLLELTADGKASLGGEIHEEAIFRVARMEKVEG